ncbi:beta-lactamase class A [Sphingopyxis italica]|uniref:Beta-lactamase class A n=1 Tax=Sphingopyxis italica TaxID=1129133 RepID=A0A7X6B9V0_9SPHN|nr:serine hydrolase [Sphingopyxis italica]NJB89853.1 beta-lactamase class A [Sphingopyxis italica]
MTKTLLAALCTAAMTLPASTAYAVQSPEIAAAADTAFDRRAAELVDLLTARIPFADYFDPSFQTAIPEAQFKAITASLIAQYGQPLSVDKVTSANGRAGTVLLRFEKGVATVALEVGPGTDARVTGLRIANFEMADDSFDKVAAEIAALPGRTGFLVAELDGGTVKPYAAAHADEQFAIGSIVKLYILDELAAQVATGKRRWSDVVPLSHQSFSSAGTANWPKDTPVTVQSLANWMISVSDNSATDTLIHLLGRKNIEARMRAAGHSAVSRNIPLLTTVEAFALKGDNFAAERAAFIAGDDQAQRALIDAKADRLILSNVDGVSFSGGPRFIDSLEWFASPNDIARAMIDLRTRGSDTAMSAMAINNGVGGGPATPWSYLGYKGGSELGVVAMSLLGQRKSDGKWFVVTASWNNPDAAVPTETMASLITRLLALAAK